MNSKKVWRPVTHKVYAAKPQTPTGEAVLADKDVPLPPSKAQIVAESVPEDLLATASQSKFEEVSPSNTQAESVPEKPEANDSLKSPLVTSRKPLSPVSSNAGSTQGFSWKPVCPSSSNSFYALDGNTEDFDKENSPTKRYKKPTFKVVETLNKEVDVVSKQKKPGTKGTGKKYKHT